MNILRLVAAEKEKASRPPNPEYQKIENAVSRNSKTQTEEYEVKVDKEDLKKRLSSVEYRVTQEKATERPFSGRFVNHKADGLYTCIVCDNAVFRSDEKFDSMCGWASFSDVLSHGAVNFTRDTTNGMSRIEVLCKKCGSHLGHVFDDGPRRTRLRYCINSASLSFKQHTTV